jgi:methylenetetrahydrofolate dehydrogenase (NADP+)/methenyltetrahydrofolate cyclohydrolase
MTDPDAVVSDPTSQVADLIDGKATAAAVRNELRETVEKLAENGVRPGLAVALVGEDPASAVYVGGKIKACKEIGIRSIEARLAAETTTAELLALIDDWNADDTIDGILVQLPLPRGIDTQAVVERISPAKDVDGFGADNLGRLAQGKPRLVACTPLGVMELLQRWGAPLGWKPAGKRAVVIGRSITVGRPMALLLLGADATVTICHSKTPDLASVVRQGEIVVAAAGQRHLVKGDWIAQGAVVIDVGIHRGEDGKLTGDVEFAEASKRARAITPVPGGVGPMTIAMLMANTVTACRQRRGLGV